MNHPTQYDKELLMFEETFSSAANADISQLKGAIAGASSASIIGVGSGGSYTVASLLCSLHESYTGRVSRPSTPLEIITNPTLAASSPVFLISAEGKNPDIVEALIRARAHSARTLHVITNRESSPLTEKMGSYSDLSTHIFALKKKDGYLATNSLLMDAIVVARSYSELDDASNDVPSSIHDLSLFGMSIPEWLDNSNEFVEKVISRKGLIVVYPPQLQAIAADLESKLSESAMSFCQLADIRSFAHGRHLWCANKADDCAILAIVDPSLHDLWAYMKAQLPEEVPILDLPLQGAAPWDLITGLIAQMHLIAGFAQQIGVDPGKPNVRQFGRDLYYTDLKKYIPPTHDEADRGERPKHEVLGASWPSKPRDSSMKRARDAFAVSIQKQYFKSIIFDYDGTLCGSQKRDSPPPESVIDMLLKLAQGEIIVGIASGRGGSIQDIFKNIIPEKYWKYFILGLYNCGAIVGIDEPIRVEEYSSEFLNHTSRIVWQLKSNGVPIRQIKVTQPFQVSVRFNDGVPTKEMWFVLADALRQAGLDLSRMVCSKHSIDIMGEKVGKNNLLAHVIQNFEIAPYEIVTMGDQGAWPGNDAALLEHRYSLSVDVPSRRMDRGWKLSPVYKSDVDATLWYLDNSTVCGNKGLNFNLNN